MKEADWGQAGGPMYRKPVTAARYPSGEYCVICNDGSVWVMREGAWEERARS